MKNAMQIVRELADRDDFRLIAENFAGGMGVFTKGPKKMMTVIWTRTDGWEHVSMDGYRRMPTWDEMCELKDMFWREDETCVQYHPAKENYVNNIPYCLHIWKPIQKYSGTLPEPPEWLVGEAGVEFGE